MSENQLLPEDPRLTAYALGELDPTEQETFERLLADSPAAQAALREIRELAGLLTTELRQEPALTLTSDQRTAILEGNVATVAPPPVKATRALNRWISRFAALATMAALVAVAAFLPAPGRQQGDPLSSEYFVNDEVRGISAEGELRLALRERNATIGDQLDGDEGMDGIGTEVTSLSAASTTRITGSTDGTRIPAENMEAISAGGRNSVHTGSRPGDSGLPRAIVVMSDGSDRNERRHKFNKYAESGGPKNYKARGKEQADLGQLSGIGNRTSGDLPRSNKEQANPKPAAESEKSNAPQDGSGGFHRPTLLSRSELKPDRNDSGKQTDFSLGSIAGKPSSGSGSGGPSPLGNDKSRPATIRLPRLEASGQKPNEVSKRPARTEPLLAGVEPNPPAKSSALGVMGGGSGGGRGPQSGTGAGGSSTDGSWFAKGRHEFAKNKGIKDVDELSSDYVSDLEYPEHKKWQELAKRRERPDKGQKAGEKDGYELAETLGEPRGGPEVTREALDQVGEGLRRLHEAAPSTEAYDPIIENPFLSSYEDPLSTFGIDVDTASYANVRRFLTQQQLPPRNAVRIEELVNYFSYEYPQPAGDQPFSVNVEAGRCPWNAGNGLVRIGLKGREIDRDKRPVSNLVFLVDVSGSMQAENKLPLVKMGLDLLTQQMTESDRVAIVTYSDTAVQRLESTNGTNKPAIRGVIDSLQAGGSTNGAGGIQLAYRAAVEHFIPGGTNRVILCTDGDFNVGVTGDDELVKLIQERARTKVFFSVFGFGMGNLKDGKLEKLADKGNGQYAYIDSQREAQKVFVDDLAGTLVTIAKDVKIQVEFNPNQVGAYRLIGYENRVMAAQDFNNDAKDAGDIGAGHTVTALYEILPAGEAPKPLLGDTLRYRKAVVPQEGGLARELLTVKLRYKLPEADTSTLVEVPINDPNSPVSGVGSQAPPSARPAMSRDFNWAAAVAGFGMILRDSQFRGQASFDMVLELAQGAKGEDKAGRRQEFIDLVKRAKALYGGGSPATDVSPIPPQAAPLTRELAEAKAAVNGKYKNLLRIVEAPADSASYGAFHEYGRWEGTSYLDQNNLPQGYWVYVAPNWYIWGDYAQRRE